MEHCIEEPRIEGHEEAPGHWHPTPLLPTSSSTKVHIIISAARPYKHCSARAMAGSLGYAERLKNRKNLGGQLGATEFFEDVSTIKGKVQKLAELVRGGHARAASQRGTTAVCQSLQEDSSAH